MARNIGKEILQGIREIKDKKISRVEIVLPTGKVISVSEIRESFGMSQTEFSKLLSVSKRTLQDWEQGRRAPTGPACSLLAIAAARPDVLREVFAA